MLRAISGFEERRGAAHGGAHWDVQLKGGGYKNVGPDGEF